jgi:hypothetical protein
MLCLDSEFGVPLNVSIGSMAQKTEESDNDGCGWANQMMPVRNGEGREQGILW